MQKLIWAKYLFLGVVTIILMGCSKKSESKLVYSDSSPDGKKVVKIWHEPADNFEFGADVFTIYVTTHENSKDLIFRIITPDLPDYEILSHIDGTLSCEWSDDGNDVSVFDSVSNTIFLDTTRAD